jgi:two-component system, sensor histidine kinase and response regulator
VRLGQILINLVNNAIKFSDKGEIVVRVMAENVALDKVRLAFSVSDSGIGMSAEQVSNLFQSFNQADTSFTRRYGGTGLGLAISKQLCELMEGSISVESQLGKGSTFLFSASFGIATDELPLTVREPRDNPLKRSALIVDDSEITRNMLASMVEPISEALLMRTTAPISGERVEGPASGLQSAPVYLSSELTGRRVLMVEDNEINRDVASELLRDLGIRVAIAVNGREGVDQVLTEAFDLVLMDIQMPVMDGLTATRLIRSDDRFHQLPIIAMTAHTMSGDRERSLEAGMNDHLTKPINPDTLAAMLSRWMPVNPVNPREPALTRFRTVPGTGPVPSAGTLVARFPPR